MTLTKEQIAATKGRIFSVTFVKRTNGEVRKMVCRTGVHLGQHHPYSEERKEEDKDNNCVTVYDMQKRGYRRIPLDAVVDCRINVREVSR